MGKRFGCRPPLDLHCFALGDRHNSTGLSTCHTAPSVGLASDVWRRTGTATTFCNLVGHDRALGAGGTLVGAGQTLAGEMVAESERAQFPQNRNCSRACLRNLYVVLARWVVHNRTHTTCH